MEKWGGHTALLHRAHEAGRLVHGDLDVPVDAYAAHVDALVRARLQRAGLPSGRRHYEALLDGDTAADLYLALACELHAAGAWERLQDRFFGRLEGLLRHWGANDAEARELLGELPGELATPPKQGTAKTRLGTYDGSGTLATWLAVIARRRWADLARAETRKTAPVREVVAEDADLDAATPLDDLVNGETGQRLEEALRAGWATLTPKEALVLLYRFGDGLPQKRIAYLLGVGEPRVSKLIKKATTKLRRKLRKDLRPGAAKWDVLRAAIERHMASFGRPPDPSRGPHA